MPQARLLQTQDHKTVLKWFFVQVHILIQSVLMTSDGVSTDYVHGGAGRLGRGGLIWTLVALCTICLVGSMSWPSHSQNRISVVLVPDKFRLCVARPHLRSTLETARRDAGRQTGPKIFHDL
jgi:hypothetical protein